ncbi:sorbosone dehydrogenase [Advenella kashmirensis W13003]|uniref:Sorbosone dehydrogenase n=1 Tax=Advenella kashmirensis W13003 TaxID=1424334 RepID=V8QUB4_9BURK|nr:sorbosone dehydrogenase family protein [Advenella kashmirensis]ETF02948.1 sorbosone dehydrogenase [Advenella kashmirensis W13003]
MSKIKWRLPLALVLGALLAACGDKASMGPDDQLGANPSLPEPKNFFSPPMQVPDGVGWPADKTPTVASGLKIEKIATDLEHPRQLYTLPNGDVLVVETNSPGTAPVTAPKKLFASQVMGRSGKGGKGGNRITLLRQKGGSGEWEKHTFLENLDSPFGVQLIGDTLYVANTGNIMKYHYVSGETRLSDPGTEFTDLPNTINHHWTKALLASPDGSKLYVGVGSNSNITENGLAVEYRRATVLEVDAKNGASRIFASGLRNPTGLDWEPQTGKLWAIVNERDEIGPDLVPDYITSVKDGGFYGWPYSYYGQHIDTRVKPQRPDLVSKAIVPDYSLGSHVAPLGVHFYTGQNLPEKYRGGVFVSEHGSWNRSPLNGYRISYIPFSDGKPAGKAEPVVSGFVSEDEENLFGAPVGLTQGKDGALLFADDVGNTVWRVTVAGQ